MLNARTCAQAEQGVPADQQRLVFNGRILDDSSSLEASGVQQGCAVYLVPAQPRAAVQVTLPGLRFTSFQVDYSTTASMLASQISSATGVFLVAVNHSLSISLKAVGCCAVSSCHPSRPHVPFSSEFHCHQ